MNTNMNSAKRRGINPGCIVFTIYSLIWLVWSFVAIFFSFQSPEAVDFLYFLAGLVVISIVSFLFGFSINRNLKKLKIVSSILVAAMPLTAIALVIYFELFE